MSTPTDTTARPIELPAAASSPQPTTDLPDRYSETAAQSLTELPVEATEDAAGDEDADALPDYRGTDFERDLGGSPAPVVLFSLLAGLAVLLGVYATAALPVQIGAGLVAVAAATLAVRTLARRRRHR